MSTLRCNLEKGTKVVSIGKYMTNIYTPPCAALYVIVSFLCVYLSLNHDVSLMSHAENKIEDVHFSLVFDNFHHGMNCNQCPSSTNTGTVNMHRGQNTQPHLIVGAFNITKIYPSRKFGP